VQAGRIGGMETKLTLLMKDGLVAITSPSTLKPVQYADLHAVISDTHWASDLIEKVSGLATAWGVVVTVDLMKKPTTAG
jgi:hypothetical protein